MPFISVVIPVYNKQKYIKDSIQSVLNQNFDDFEIIIIDDGSTDHSVEILETLTDSKINLYKQSNHGVSYTRNKGVQLSSGKLIAFLDADDYWYPDHLQKIVKLYHQYPEAHFFATAYEVEYPGGLIKKFRLYHEPKSKLFSKFYQYIKGSPIFYTSNFAIKKDVYIKEKGFKENIHGEDTEFFYRLGYQYLLAYDSSITLRYKNQSENSLFAHYETDRKVLLLKELKEFEQKDKELKRILDLNRFAWVMEYKVLKKNGQAKELMKQISIENMNFFQRILLKTPGKILKILKRIQQFLIQNKIYLTPFEKS